MTNKKLLISIGIFILLVLPMVQAAFVFQRNVEVNFSIPVFKNDNSKADNTITCTLTLRNPSSDILLNDVTMTVNSSGYANYTIPGTNVQDIGDYPTVVACDNTADFGFSSFPITITPSGGEPISPGEGSTLLGAFIVILSVGVLFLVLTILCQNQAGKVFFVSMSIIIFIGALGFGVTVMQQLFGDIGALMTSFGAFYRLLIILSIGGGTALILFLIVVAFKSFHSMRGMANDDDED